MSVFEISKDFHWSASHVLHGLPEGHPCGRMHGHNYVARVTIAAEHLDSTGFVVDYGELRPFGRYIDEELDHRHLNDVMDGQPSSERLAKHLAGVVRRILGDVTKEPALVSVAVSETPKTWASWTSGERR